MEKKNTLLLTVIAVATLLVAVVGATFAYFSLTTSTEDATITGTVTAVDAGTATIINGEQYLTLSLTAEDMAKQGEDTPYYAVAGQTDTLGEHGTSVPIDISKANYSGGASGTTYKCPVRVTVTADGDMITKNTLKEGWVSLDLYGEAVSNHGVGVVGATWDGDGSKLTVDLQKALMAGSDTMVGKSVILGGDIMLPGPSVDGKAILKASLYLTNKDSEDQSAIANQNLSVQVKVEPNGECSVSE